MSARSMVRASERERRRMERRGRAAVIARRTAIGTAGVLGAGAVAASGASAANFPVTNTNDAGAGSLRDAIASANALPGPDDVTFSGISGRITLTTGQIAITDPLNVQGPGAGTLTVDGGSNSRIFSVGNIATPDRQVTISGLRLVNGDDGDGGAVFNATNGQEAAELTIADSVLANNYADGNGGAIYSDGGSLTVTNTTLSRNNTSGKYDGGAIFVNNTDGDTPVEVTISGSTLTRNAAGETGGGVALLSPDGDARILRSAFSANDSLDDGGGLYLGSGEGLTVESSAITGNDSFRAGGGIEIRSPAQPVSITNSTVAANTARFGGGLYLYNTNDVPITVANSTIAGNEAGTGGGIARYGGASDPLTVSSTIVAGNIAETGPDISQYSAIGSTTVGNSLIGSTAGGAPLTESPAGTNKLGVDPVLGPLADNGGPTPTMLPALSSPAVDAGVANSLTTDQRGLPRTVRQPTLPLSTGSDGTDVGAAELAAVPADDTVDGGKVKAKKTQKQKGGKIVVKVQAGAAEDVEAVASGSVKAGKKVKLKKVTKSIAAGKTMTLKLKASKSGAEAIWKKLDAGKSAKAKLKVTLTDAAGNKLTKKPKVKLKG